MEGEETVHVLMIGREGGEGNTGDRVFWGERMATGAGVEAGSKPNYKGKDQRQTAKANGKIELVGQAGRPHLSKLVF